MATSPSMGEFSDTEATAEADKLCSKCCDVIKISRILSDVPHWEKTSECQFEQFEHYAERRDVELSSQRGCHLCSLALSSENTSYNELWSRLDGYGSTTDDRHPDPKVSTRVIVEISAFNPAETPLELGHTLRFDFHGSLGESREDWHREGSRQLIAYPQPPAHSVADSSGLGATKIHTMAAFSKSTGSNASFGLAQWWLQRCLREHKSCAQIRRRSPAGLPDRLIHVGDIQKSTCWPYLVIRSDIEKDDITYLTLSHCWGGVHPLTLTSQNFEALRKTINPAYLPKTFRDAMIVTRRLGFEYIWIDSLCVMQDSEEDWRVQSSMMGDIYQNSICTIAALGAKNGHQGCFVECNPLKYFPCFIDAGANNTRYRIVGPSIDTRDEYIRMGATAAPLHKRAWVVQERLLSPRTLAYGSSGIYWDCFEGGQASAWWPDGGPDSSRTLTKSSMAVLLQPHGSSSAQRSRFFSAWKSLLVEYSQCRLTFTTDRLTAIAGIVNLITAHSALTFIGGVWKEYLLECLLWRVCPFPHERLLAGLPSWSWASIDGGVGFDIVGGYFPQWKAEVLHVPTLDPLTGLPTTDDPFASQLILRAPLKQVEWSRSGIFYQIHRTDKRYGPGEWWPDTEIASGREIWCLHLALWTCANPTDKPEDTGLVIVPRNAARDEWSRIGWFKQEQEADEEHSMFFEVESRIVRLL